MVQPTFAMPMPMPMPAPMPMAAMAPQFAPASEDGSGALTYQVYAPDALPSQRPMMSSLASGSFQAPVATPSIALRVCLVLVGVCFVVGTAALIIAGASDDSPHASKAAASAEASSLPSASVASALSAAPEPEPPVVAAVAPSPPDPPPAPVPAKPAKAKAKAAGSSAPGLRTVALPPNPFAGGAGGGTKPAKKK